MEKILRQTYLFDFYGDLLTPHQKEIFEEVICNDISCSEVAAREGVSRQSINELVHKSERQMESYENKLHLMDRFLKLRALVGELETEIRAEMPEHGSQERFQEMLTLCGRIMEEL